MKIHILLFGILEKTYSAYDNTLFTPVESVWNTHLDHNHKETEEEHEEHKEHEEYEEGEYTALLVKTTNPSAALNLISELNKEVGILAVNPSTVLRELLSNIDIVAKIVYILCAVIGIMSFIIIYMITLMIIHDLKQDIILMRLIGLNRKTILGIIFIQNIITILLGVVLAFVLTRASLMLINNITSSMGIVMNYLKIYNEEYIIITAIVIISFIPTIFGLYKMFRRSLENEN